MQSKKCETRSGFFNYLATDIFFDLLLAQHPVQAEVLPGTREIGHAQRLDGAQVVFAVPDVADKVVAVVCQVLF